MKFKKYKCINCRRITKSKNALDLHLIDCRIKLVPTAREFLRKIEEGVYIYDNKI